MPVYKTGERGEDILDSCLRRNGERGRNDGKRCKDEEERNDGEGAVKHGP